MSKSLLLIPLVVLITGCNDIYSAIDYKYPKDKHGFWAECVRNEYLKYKTSSPTLEKAIDAKCKREMMIKEIRKHRKEQKELEETVQEAIEYNKEFK